MASGAVRYIIGEAVSMWETYHAGEGTPMPVDVCVLQGCTEDFLESIVSRLRLKKHLCETHFWNVKVILSSGKQKAVLLQVLGVPVSISC